MTRRGTVTLPKDVRGDLNEETVFEVSRREDGVIELRPYRLIPEAQAWFWTERWQTMEREADAAYESGRYRSFSTPDAFLAELERIAAEEHPDHEQSVEP